MTILFFLLLFGVVLPLWGWMVARIWKDSPAGARATFILFVPAYVWAYRLWQHQHDALRIVVIPNLIAFAIMLAAGYKTAQSVAKPDSGLSQVRTSKEWENWCKEQNDATYDPVLGTCVENNREEALARSQNTDVFGRLTRYLEKRGIKAEIDQSASAGALQPKLVTPEVAKVSAFYFLPLSMSQPIVSLVLCVSEAACAKYAEGAAERGLIQFVRNKNLLLVLPAETTEDARINALKEAFENFKAG
ncbi:MAG: hypothetical protein HYS18_02750 [Burkholderiales bacterium]|nr:hypothetical protein [Burkholderiales bacterium]